MSEMQTNILHVYAQGAWHDEAYLCGTVDAITKLRDAVDQAIAHGFGKSDSFVSDGEGFDLHVICVSEDQAYKLRIPYTDEAARGGGLIAPWDLVMDRNKSSGNMMQRNHPDGGDS